MPFSNAIFGFGNNIFNLKVFVFLLKIMFDKMNSKPLPDSIFKPESYCNSTKLWKQENLAFIDYKTYLFTVFS